MLDKTNGNEQQYLCAKDVHFDEINLTDLKKMYFSPEEQSKYRVRKGDLLVVEGGACGTCAILRTDVNDIFIQNSIMIVRGDKTKCVNDFIAYSIQALVQKGYTESVCNKATIMHFTKEKLGNTLISLPPLPEQQEIVTYLDTKAAKIDEYISIAEKKIAALEELKQTIITEAVTRGIHKDVPMKDSGVKWIGEIPGHWDLKRTAMLFSENRKKNINYEFDHALKFNYGKLVSKNEIGDVSSLKETYMAYTIINKNDIAINCLNLNYDFVSQRVAISPQKGIITSAYLIITPRQGVEAMYYNYLFKAMDSKKLFHGMGTGIRLTLSFSELKKQQIPVPLLSEQQEIVTYIEEKVANINQLCQAERSQIEKLKEYKQRLISDVVTGKVKVTND